jgi:LmbE family N-acetylglucosaminyl deacetylase
MRKRGISRRGFVERSFAATAPAIFAAGGLPAIAADSASGQKTSRLLKVVCVGGHPDDPESGCAGTLARYAEAGHNATIIYLTRGERGISGKSNDEAAAIRTAECDAACKVMGAKPVFAGQIDGSTELNKGRVEEMTKLLAAENPDVLFTHWPVDTHMDHQVASLLAIRAYLALARRPQLYFFEVNTGSQSLGFTPNTYVDITSVREKKKAALLSHRSQDGEGIWKKHHEVIADFRGREAGVGVAEAFFHLSRDSKTSTLPGL